MCSYILLSVTCFLIGAAGTVGTTTGFKEQNISIPVTESGDFDDFVPLADLSLIDPFDWKLLQQLSLKGYRNVIISPLSLKLVLALLYEGAAGITEKEFQSVLNFPVEKKVLRETYRHLLDILKGDRKEYVLNIGTRIFLDKSFTALPTYKAKAKNAYETDIVETNFTNSHEASRSINTWVDYLTNGRMRKLVNPDDVEDAVLLVTNALYFKGFWRQEFSRNRTLNGRFHLSPTQTISVEYMVNNASKYFHTESKALNAQILRIPYKGRKFSMFIILPNAKDGLHSLLQNLDLQTLKRNIHLMEEVVVEVILPKFKFDFETRFSKILQDLDLHAMFQSVASFPGIVRNDGHLKLVVSDIVQKAGIEVNEEGSISYAATDVQLHNKFGEPDIIFNVSHPFLFFIEEQTTGTILFVGKVENPLETDPDPLPSKFGDSSEHNRATTPAATQQPIGLPPSQYSPSLQYDDSTARFNFFDWELLQNLNIYENVLVSPASIKTSLAMILEGAYGNTSREIISALRLPEDSNKRRYLLQQLTASLSDAGHNTILESSNAVFVSDQYQLIPDYKTKLEQYFRAILKIVNFSNAVQTASAINSQISNSTRGLIQEIISPADLDRDTAVVLTNALYFKAFWKNEFDESSTRVKCFYSPKRGCVNSFMMQMVATVNYIEFHEIHATVIELPYGDGKHAMLILLPHEKNNLAQFMRDIRHVQFANILHKLEPTEIILELPRFEIDYSLDLIPTLQAMEVKEAFGPNANLSGIVYDKKVHIDSILHKTKIEVNEKGTEAAAASAVLVTPLMGSSMPRVVADHPFLFFIYKVKTGGIIFEGILNEPKEAMNIAIKASPGPLTSRQGFAGQSRPLEQQQYVNYGASLSQQLQRNPYNF